MRGIYTKKSDSFTIGKVLFIFYFGIFNLQQNNAQICTVNAGLPSTFCQENIQLQGEVSSINGILESIEWVLINQPNGANANIINPNSIQAQVSGNLEVGDYTFEIKMMCTDSQYVSQQVVHSVIEDVTQAYIPSSIINVGCYYDDGIQVNGGIYTPLPSETVQWEVLNGIQGIFSDNQISNPLFYPQNNPLECNTNTYQSTFLQYTISNGVCNSSDIIELRYFQAENDFVAQAMPKITCGQCVSLMGTCNSNGTGEWTYSGTGMATFSNPNEANTEVCIDQYGTYIFTWTVNSGCNIGSASDTVTFKDINENIVNVYAGPDEEYCELPNSIVLNASPLNNNQIGEWIQLSGSPAQILNPSNPSTAVNGIVSGGGPYQFSWEILGSECGNYDIVTISEHQPFSWFEPIENNDCIAENITINEREILKSSVIPAKDFDSLIVQFTLLQASPLYLDNADLAIKIAGSTSNTGYSTGGMPSPLQFSNIGTSQTLKLYNNLFDITNPNDVAGFKFTVHNYVGNFKMQVVINDGCSTKTFLIDRNPSGWINSGVNAGTDVVLPCNVHDFQLSANQANSYTDLYYWSYISGPINPFNATNQYIHNPILNNLPSGKYTFAWNVMTGPNCPPNFDEVSVLISDTPPLDVSASIQNNELCGPITLNGYFDENTAINGTWTQISPNITNENIIINNNQIIIDNTQANTTYLYRWYVENACGIDSVDISFLSNTTASPSLAWINTNNAVICTTTHNTFNQLIAEEITSGEGLWAVISQPENSEPVFIHHPNQEMTNFSLSDGLNNPDNYGTYLFEWQVSDIGCTTITTDTVMVNYYCSNNDNINIIENIDLCGIDNFPYTYSNLEAQFQENCMDINNFEIEWQVIEEPSLNSAIIISPNNHISDIVFYSQGTYKIQFISPCGEEEIVTFNVASSNPISFAGEDQVSCDSQNGIFYMNANNLPIGNTGVWVLDDFTGNGEVIINDIYNPNTSIELTSMGTATLSWQSLSNNGICPPNYDEVNITWMGQSNNTDTLKYCDVNTIQLNSNYNNNFDVTWSIINSDDNLIFSHPTEHITNIENLGYGTHEINLNVSNDYCQSNDTYIIIIDSIIIANAGVNQVICQGDSIILDKNQQNGVWNVLEGNTQNLNDNIYNPIDNLNQYIFEYEVENGLCSSNDFMIVNVFNEELLNYNINHPNCNQTNGSIILNEEIENEGIVFNWSNGTNEQNLTNVSSGVYTVTLSYDNSCSFTKSFELEINDAPFTIIHNIDTIVCPNSLVEVYVDSIAGYSYEWSNGDNASSTILNADNNAFQLTITNSLGCQGVQSFNIALLNTPIVNLGEDINICNDTSIVLSPNINSTEYLAPFYLESFENSLGTWTQSTNDDGNWIRDNNGTPSYNTGPVSGANNSNYYMYHEASYGSVGSQIILLSQEFDLSNKNNSILSFYYNMNGSTIGSLELEISNDQGSTWNNVWSLSGHQGIEWEAAVVDLSDFNQDIVQFRFISTKGTSFTGDIAIDDISIAESAYSFYWSNGEQTESIIINPQTSNTYTLDLITADNCIVSDEIEIIKCNYFGGHVWIDENGNGLQDDTEEMISGTTITLLNLDESPVLMNREYSIEDDFNIVDYNNSHGTYDWSNTQWEEVDNLSGGPTSGNVFIENNELKLYGSQIIRRDIILPNNANNVAFNLEYKRNQYDVNDVVKVSYFDGQWNVIDYIITNNENESDIEFKKIMNIPISPNTSKISIKTTAQEDEWIAIDKVKITFDLTENYSTITDENGYYEFNSNDSIYIKGNEYKISMYSIDTSLNNNRTLTYQNINNDNNDDIDNDAEKGQNEHLLIINMIAPINNPEVNFDFGLANQSIAGCAWYDQNFNGLREENEILIPNILVNLLNENDSIIAQTLTNNNGIYTFQNIELGDYQVQFNSSTVLNGILLDTPTIQDITSNNVEDELDSDINPLDNKSNLFNINIANKINNIDAGFTFGNLPVELSQFNIYNELCNNELEWETLSENNNSHFEVEHSNDGIHFNTISRIEGNGNSNYSINYSFSHSINNNHELHYYRLKQVDFDGKYTYSDIKVIESNCSKSSLVEIYPNPSADIIHIQDNNKEQFNLSLVDASMKSVPFYLINDDLSYKTIDINHLPKGFYFVIIEYENNIETHKIIKID